MADTGDLGSPAVRCAGSSPVRCTNRFTKGVKNMDGKVRVKDLLYKQEQLEKTIMSLERLTGLMFTHSDEFQKLFEQFNVEKVSSFEVNGAANYLRDYLKMVTNAINNAEAAWPKVE